MGELEYYIISEKEDLYPAQDQKGYHTAAPFTNWENLRLEALQIIAQCGGRLKYGHSEVGNFTSSWKRMQSCMSMSIFLNLSMPIFYKG